MRTIILTFSLTFLFINVSTIPAMAYPQYSEESKKLGREAGLEYDVPLDEIMRRQEALKSGKAIESTTTSEKGQETSNTRRIKGGVDEYHIATGTGKQSVKVTDTDDLHIYSNEYESPSGYGAKYSYDEFKVGGKETPANDGYKHGNIDELHINENYRQNVWKPDYKVQRLGIDQFKLPNEL